MKKIFTLIAGVLMASAANATPFKNLYVQAEAYPSGAGEVYLDAKNDEDAAYVSEKSDDYGETAYIKLVIGENGSDNTSTGWQNGYGIYEVKAYASAADDYELVCYSNEIREDGIYSPANAYVIIHGASESEGRTFDYVLTGEGDWININNPEHAQDGHSQDGPTRDECLASGTWSESPDAVVYAIFRKTGDELPKFTTEQEDAINGITVNSAKKDAVYTVSGQQVGTNAKGILISNGRKVLVK
jgi:hypothetical protein